MSLSIEKVNQKYKPSLVCDACRKGYDKGDIIQLYQRKREGNSLIFIHQSCLDKRIAKAAAMTFEESAPECFAQPVANK